MFNKNVIYSNVFRYSVVRVNLVKYYFKHELSFKMYFIIVIDKETIKAFTSKRNVKL